ncbi:type II toxin-antitoxin system HicB family antitoxin [Dolichospermum sp. ST_sed1]|nr:type II toxin-antitoxin system HicB family antitoxin [Dolichospermum sp. ST_sed1]MDD1427297.1 type II toxin-antitoxin system HicB family antitoxin [Dolichospermum sp. ST_sed9]MDD1431725.1 type II toxin-antitoxin system HicB family antitoxin [Dolichospermum sp. ST_sed6]MDD1447606.1 type II toxin-antitoxin system HicB family antitoxin [Dolichospermum sp. ST_sed8]MDD1461215.1 type II toxin-antitoxin system HicB family antitoxin [Dolichospermum sp. ST_sed2]MDD1466726.1 type II toxin-antitoxin s
MKFNTGIIMTQLVYPALLTADEKDGGFVVTFRDLPEAITQGNSWEEALNEAADCLEEAIALRIDDKLEIPQPSHPKNQEYLVAVPAQTAIKAALYLAMREKGISKVQLASTLNIHEKEVRRILDPHHATKLSTMERTLAVLGQRIELQITAK